MPQNKDRSHTIQVKPQIQSKPKIQAKSKKRLSDHAGVLALSGAVIIGGALYMSSVMPSATASMLAAQEGVNPASAQDQDLSLTIYNNNLALVRDARSISYGKGRSTITLPGVSSQINATTVSFSAPGVGIIEQNFDYDLLTPAKLMEKAVGKTVTLVRTNPATGKETRREATVLSVNNGVVIKTGNTIEVLRDDNLPTRVIFDKVPENLRANPTLSVVVDSENAGRKPTTLTYLTGGLGWRADYVALFDEGKGEMNFKGWVTLNNVTQTSFVNADVTMVAGNVNSAPSPRSRPRRSSSIRSGGIEATNEARLGDNYLYPLPGRTSVASNQTKQVAFVDAPTVEAGKGYEYQANDMRTINTPQNVDVRIAFSNSAAKGLGAALPAGVVRVYTNDSEGRSQYIGENQITHTAGGADLSIKIGEAFDVTVQPALTNNRIVNKRRTEKTMRYTLRNAKREPATVTIRQNAGWSGLETEILSESIESRNPSHNNYVWDVEVPAEGEAVLTFSVRQTSPY